MVIQKRLVVVVVVVVHDEQFISQILTTCNMYLNHKLTNFRKHFLEFLFAAIEFFRNWREGKPFSSDIY